MKMCVMSWKKTTRQLKNSTRRFKKRRLNVEEEFRDKVSRALLKSVNQIMNTFFRHARFDAKKVLFEQLVGLSLMRERTAEGCVNRST
jgi:hypothetical protein